MLERGLSNWDIKLEFLGLVALTGRKKLTGAGAILSESIYGCYSHSAGLTAETNLKTENNLKELK